MTETTTAEIPNAPTIQVRIYGSLTDVRVGARVVAGEAEEYVRADGRGGSEAAGEARAALFKCGLTVSADGRDFVARDSAAVRFWCRPSGLGTLPESWDIYVPDDLVDNTSTPREPPDPARVDAFSALFTAEPDDERAVAMLATKEGWWFFCAMLGSEYADSHEQARYDRLLDRAFEARRRETGVISKTPTPKKPALRPSRKTKPKLGVEPTPKPPARRRT